MSTATTVAGPDLSALDDALRRRIDVAVARAEESSGWSRLPASPCGRSGPGWVFRTTGGTFILYDNGVAAGYLPDPENDPAAAWELATAERIAVVPSEDGWYAVVPDDLEHGCVRGTSVPTLTIHGREMESFEPADSPGRAVVDAFLAKHRQGGR